jgi:Fe/S biogenesis protein NfuA
MIEISPTAQKYFIDLLTRQEIEGNGLRMQVINPGTPSAGCELQFCPEGDQASDDKVVAYDGFTMFVPLDSEEWLQEAEIDFEESATGGQLTIKAPNIKGHAPAESSPLHEQVAWLIETEINPGLASHGGRVAVQEVTPEGLVVLQFGGGCQGCGMVDVTLKEGIEKTLMQRLPQITGITDATDHSTGENPYYS